MDDILVDREGESVWAQKRAAMVAVLNEKYRISDKAILNAMSRVRRHIFVPDELRFLGDPYGDHPCKLPAAQTISQPFIVAHMIQRLGLRAGDKVLEVGTGSGYQAAVLAELGMNVYSVERVMELAELAQANLMAEGYRRVRLRVADGSEGWPKESPFDAIIVTCAALTVPQALVDQLADGGRLIIPLGSLSQRLVLFEKLDGQLEKEEGLAVRFVPMLFGKPG